MKLVMLGTGHALVTKYYNTCFLLDSEDDGCLLVDAGGGSGILAQMKRAEVDWRRITDLFLSHTHIDHLLGAVWVLRLFCHHMNEGEFPGTVRIHGAQSVLGTLREVAELLLRPQETRFFGDRVLFIPAQDGECRTVIGRPLTFFDIQSAGAAQFGFAMEYEPGRVLAFCGDEPYHECNRAHVEGAAWLLHEAFCLGSEEGKYDPHPIHHGTVAEACEAAERLGVKNLVLFHTEDDTYGHRRELYEAEGRTHFSGALYVPDDLDAIEL